MEPPIYAYRLTALSPWAWHGLAVPSGMATIMDIVTDTAMAFATAVALGMAPRSPLLAVQTRLPWPSGGPAVQDLAFPRA